jgi:hypothetical protein
LFQEEGSANLLATDQMEPEVMVEAQDCKIFMYVFFVGFLSSAIAIDRHEPDGNDVLPCIVLAVI